MEVLGEGAQERPAFVDQQRCQARGCIEGVGDLEELRRLQATASKRPLDRRADVVCSADPHAGAIFEQGTGLIGLVEPASDDDRVTGRLERVGEAA
jgi:hypothetical protein